MSACTVPYAHNIGDTVKVKALDLKGQVCALMSDAEGLSYRVIYWSDGTRKAEWMFGWEIEA